MSATARRGRRVEDEAGLAEIVRSMRTIAVLGMKGEDRQDESAFSIPAMLQARGFRIIPVNPKLERALGETAYPDLASVPDSYDLLDVFRSSAHVTRHAEQLLALPPERRPRVVWLQSGIRNELAAELLVAAGIDVVQDRCLGVYASRYVGR